MGLFRLFWIPVGEPSAHGTYVRYNADELLAIAREIGVPVDAPIPGEHVARQLFGEEFEHPGSRCCVVASNGARPTSAK